MRVPFFRPSITQAEIDEVSACLQSGWLTTGPRAARFEARFAEATGGKHALALNSCTAALHLAVEALELRVGQAVLVPAMTFAATAEIVRYQGGVPLLVDCDRQTLNMDLDDARRKLAQLRSGQTPLDPALRVTGIIAVHVGGLMMDMDAVTAFAREQGLWVVEDAAHAFPAAYRSAPGAPWRRCGEGTSAATCFSFYANKSITTGEGGMVVTDDARLADRMRQMSLHGLSQDAWQRQEGTRPWDYRIVAPGFKYNMADIAAALGNGQLTRAAAMHEDRAGVARFFRDALAGVDAIELPPAPDDRIHAWHLFPIRLRLDRLTIDRDRFIGLLKERGVNCTVHWRPLHLHPYYEETFGWRPSDLPVATRTWTRLVSLPLFPGMSPEETGWVVESVRDLCREHTRG